MNTVLQIVAASLLLAACGGREVPAPNEQPLSPPKLDSFTASRETVDLETLLDGYLEATHRSTVASEVRGRVVELPFDIDDMVRKGEVIVRFRDAEQRAQVQRAEAQVKEAQARLGEAELAHQRGVEVFARRLIARADLDRLNAALETARARLEAAQAELRQASEQLEHTVVRAPYSGIVEQRHIELGETATVGQALITGLSLEHLRAVVDVPQSQIAPLREHRQARVLLADGASLEAADLRIPPAADPATHTFRAKVTLPPGDHGVYPGTLVKIAFKRGETTQLRVPAGAVVQRSEISAAYVIRDDNRIEFRQLRLGRAGPNGDIHVLAGLEAGERIALDPIAAGIALKEQATP